MTPHAETETLRDALARYFEDNGFGPDGGYGDAWVDFKLGPIPFPFPNTASRKRAVRFHDLHHILTGYRTDLVGEFEISAWELASGCRDHVAAWHLNLGGLFAGALVAPRRVFRAFLRGRHMRNFYAESYESLLGLTVGEARRRVSAIEEAPRATARDLALFALSLAAGAVIGTAQFLVVLPMALVAAPWLHLAAKRARRAPVTARA
jgi:hypothetical protein